MCTFFPPRFWGLDPLFNAKVKLNISDVIALNPYPEFPGVYCLTNHPVLGVHVMGDVISIRELRALILYQVDDGSGVMSCCQWRRSEDSRDGLYVPAIGELVSVYGRVEEYRNEKQIRISIIVSEEDPNSEPLHWLEVEQMKRTVYSQPFSPPPGLLPSTHHHNRSLAEIVETSVLAFLSIMKGTSSLNNLCSNQTLRYAVWEAVQEEQHVQEEQNVQHVQHGVHVSSGGGGSSEEGRRGGEQGGGGRGGGGERDGEGRGGVRDGGRGEGGGIERVREEEVWRELRRIVMKISRSGKLVPVRNTTMRREVEYEAFSEEKHLYPVILDYMRTKLQHPRAAQLGVREDWIVEDVRQKEGLRYVAPATVTAAIQHLEEDSRVFSVGKQTYKMVT